MTDSTIENKPGDGGFDIGSSADELFGEIAEEPLETDVDRDDDGESEDDQGVEDQTAATVFGQLKDEVDRSGTDELLADESPEDIIASADEPEPEPEVDDDLLADEEALTNLLLTERTKGEEFLWIDAGDSAGVNDSDDSPSDAPPSTDDRSAESTAEGDVAEDAAGAIESTDSNDEPATETQRSVLETNARPDEGNRSISSDGASTDSSESSPFAADESEDEPDEPEVGEIEPAEPEFSDIEPEGIGFADSDSEETTRSTRSEADADPTETDESDGDSTSEPSTESDWPEDADDVPTGFFGRLRAKLASLF
ncbi:hypothetical protein [Natrialba sp. INN-245]|uniref:hypothetical protein n=1 Tax=Natrialba sp. INN-245 TaxID=2690967 RepID=UPI001312DFBE|nr:hypothetical protein [Natrialba sp. INN-245]MWV40082.1 hypothetical protein [Natrialba sp. INN-245]